jgi:hypothetical protein
VRLQPLQGDDLGALDAQEGMNAFPQPKMIEKRIPMKKNLMKKPLIED